MMNAFDFVNAINFTKKDLMTGTENDTLAEASYVPYVTNRSLSYFPDTVMYSNDMNMHADLDNKLQFHYLINSIRPKKRFSKWAKRVKDSDFDAVKEYYNYNNTQCEVALSLLSPDQIIEIKRRMNKGGRQ